MFACQGKKHRPPRLGAGPRYRCFPALWLLCWLQLKSLPQRRLGWEATAPVSHSWVYLKVDELRVSEEKPLVRLVIQLS